MRAGDDVPHVEMHENVDVDWLVPTRDNCFDPEILLTRLAVYFDAGELRVVLLLTSVCQAEPRMGRSWERRAFLPICLVAIFHD